MCLENLSPFSSGDISVSRTSKYSHGSYSWHITFNALGGVDVPLLRVNSNDMIWKTGMGSNITVVNAIGGSFVLCYRRGGSTYSSGNIDPEVSASAMASLLGAVDEIQSVDVSRSSLDHEGILLRWNVTFLSSLTRGNILPLEVCSSSLGLSTASVQISTIVEGNEVAGTFTLTVEGDTTEPISHAATASALRMALSDLPSVEEVETSLEEVSGAGGRRWTVTFLTLPNGNLSPMVLGGSNLTATGGEDYVLESDIRTVQNGSAVRGHFSLAYEKVEGKEELAISPLIAYNATAEEMYHAIRSMEGIGDLEVTRSTADRYSDTYVWSITFIRNLLPRPLMINASAELQGHHVNVTVNETQLANAVTGSFRLQMGTSITGPLSLSASAEEVERALLDLPSGVTGGVVEVSDHVLIGNHNNSAWKIRFTNFTDSSTRMSADSSLLKEVSRDVRGVDDEEKRVWIDILSRSQRSTLEHTMVVKTVSDVRPEVQTILLDGNGAHASQRAVQRLTCTGTGGNFKVAMRDPNSGDKTVLTLSYDEDPSSLADEFISRFSFLISVAVDYDHDQHTICSEVAPQAVMITFEEVEGELYDLLLMDIDDSTLTGGHAHAFMMVPGSSLLGGFFRLSFRDYFTSYLPHNTSTEVIARELEALPSVGKVRVTTQTSQRPWGGVVWAVTFLSNAGELPLLEADSSALSGIGAYVEISQEQAGNMVPVHQRLLTRVDDDEEIVSGVFSLRCADRDGMEALVRDIPFNVSAAELEAQIEALGIFKDISVIRESRTAPGTFKWDIYFLTETNPIPAVAIDSYVFYSPEDRWAFWSGDGPPIVAFTVSEGSFIPSGTFTLRIGTKNTMSITADPERAIEMAARGGGGGGEIQHLESSLRLLEPRLPFTVHRSGPSKTREYAWTIRYPSTYSDNEIPNLTVGDTSHFSGGRLQATIEEEAGPSKSYVLGEIPVNTGIAALNTTAARSYTMSHAVTNPSLLQVPLQQATRYFVRVKARNSYGWSKNSVVLNTTIGSVPRTVQHLRAVSAFSDALEISFAPPADDGGFPIVEYEITCYEGNSPQHEVQAISISTGEQFAVQTLSLVPQPSTFESIRVDEKNDGRETGIGLAREIRVFGHSQDEVQQLVISSEGNTITGTFRLIVGECVLPSLQYGYDGTHVQDIARQNYLRHGCPWMKEVDVAVLTEVTRTSAPLQKGWRFHFRGDVGDVPRMEVDISNLVGASVTSQVLTRQEGARNQGTFQIQIRSGNTSLGAGRSYHVRSPSVSSSY